MLITKSLQIIEMEGFSVTLLRKPIKNINLRIQRSGEVQLSAPLRTPLKTIYSFLQSKHSWIKTHSYRLQKLEQEVSQALTMEDYVNFQGRHYELQIYNVVKNQRIELNGDQIHLFVKPEASLAYKQRLLTEWYITKMQQCLPLLFEKWESIIGVSANKISIKKMRARWGSCQPIKKHIVLNLRLMEKPLICLEYVIVHELVHLLEASHNHRFHALMNHYLPEWKAIKKGLT